MIPRKKLEWGDVEWHSADTVIENNTKILIEERARSGWVNSSNSEVWDGTYHMGTGITKHRTPTASTTNKKPFRYGKTDYPEQDNRD